MIDTTDKKMKNETTRTIGLTLPYRKLSGAGNTFILVDMVDLPDGIDLASLAPLLCDPLHPHQGADGLIVIDGRAGVEIDGTDFRMLYYNRDGSTGMMCGNGGRCAVRFAADRGYIADQGELFFSNAGVGYHASLVDDEVRIVFPDPKEIRPDWELSLSGQNLKLYFVDVGTPHLILPVDRSIAPDGLDSLDIDRWGPEVRNHPAVAPGGANANFIELLPDRSGIALRTFERGVEGETGACGTGAIASALVASTIYSLLPPVMIVPTSGSPLRVDFSRNNEGNICSPVLQGKAETVMEGEISI